MRILHVIDALDDGSSTRQIQLLAPTLVQSGIAVEVCCLGPAGRQAEALRQAGITVHAPGWTRWFDGPALWTLRRLLRTRDYELIHIWRLPAFCALPPSLRPNACTVWCSAAPYPIKRGCAGGTAGPSSASAAWRRPATASAAMGAARPGQRTLSRRAQRRGRQWYGACHAADRAPTTHRVQRPARAWPWLPPGDLGGGRAALCVPRCPPAHCRQRPAPARSCGDDRTAPTSPMRICWATPPSRGSCSPARMSAGCRAEATGAGKPRSKRWPRANRWSPRTCPACAS